MPRSSQRIRLVRRPSAFRSGWRFALVALPLTVTCGDATSFQGGAPEGGIDAVTPISDAAIEGCTAQSLVSSDRDIDMIFAISTSASMATVDGDASADSRWVSTSNALRTLVAELEGQHYGAGLLFFPSLHPGDGGTPAESCASADYEIPAVPLAALDSDGVQASAIDAALGARTLAGGNAATAALTGALKLAARAKSRTGHIVQTILVTDGTLDPCGGDVTSAAAAAAEVFQRDHLETYVLGVGSDAAGLDPIAAAGGTFHAYTATDAEGTARALSTLGATLRRCHFYFPMTLPAGDFEQITFVMDFGKPSAESLPRVDGDVACGQEAGWFYNSDVSPAYAIFCPAACDGLLRDPKRDVTARLGCY